MAPEAQTNDPYENLQTGDKVKHPKFGEGTIMQRTGTGDVTKLVVAFAEEGEKYLMARYAKLRKIQPIEGKEEKPAPAAVAHKHAEKPVDDEVEDKDEVEEDEDELFDDEDFSDDEEEELDIASDEDEEEE